MPMPMPMPRCRCKVFQMTQFKNNSKASIMHYAGGVLSPHFNNIFFTDSIPMLLSVLGNIFTTSKLTNKQFSCKFPFLLRSSTMFNICCVSCILVSIFKTSGKRHFSTKIDRFSTAVSLPLVIIHAGLLSL